MNQKKVKRLRKLAREISKINPLKDAQDLYDKMKKDFKVKGKR